MVSTRPSDDRGQLLLVGAIAIALVILGTVVMLNGMKFTDTVGSKGNDEAFTDASRTVEMIETDLARLSSRVRNDTSLTTFESALKENVTQYTRTYSNMSIGQGSVYIDVSLDTSCSSCQYRLLENTSQGDFTGGRQNTTVGRDMASIPEFNLTIADDEFPGNPASPVDASFWIAVRNETGATWRMRLNATRTGTPPTDTRYITTYNDSGVIASYSSASDPWFENDEDVEIRLLDGCVDANGGAGFTCLDGLAFANGVEGPYTISFNNTFSTPGGNPAPPGQNAEGTFRMVADGEGPADSRIGLDTPVFTLVYERPEVQYQNTISINGSEP